MLHRSVQKFSKTTEKLRGEYPIDIPVAELHPLFEATEYDPDMFLDYAITTEAQMKFFKSKGVPITKRCDWFLTCGEEYVAE